MDDLLKNLAPIPKAAWSEIEDQARDVLTLHLAGRRLVDFSGPHGWSRSSIPLGRVSAVSGAPADGVQGALRQVQPLVEIRTPFDLDRRELEAAARGAEPDLAPLVKAAERVAQAEDRAIFHGWEAAGIQGIFGCSPHGPLPIPEDTARYPETVVKALGLLQDAGVPGPYGIALGPRCWASLLAALDPSGFPVLDRIRRIVDGPVVRAPAIDGAVLMSVRGGDFELTVGRDISIGYDSHTADTVRLYFVESLTYRTVTPEAAVPLVYAD